MTAIVFWISIGLLIYVYFGYPIAVILAASITRRGVKKSPVTPYITIVISAFNEEGHIAESLENKLQLDYPSDKMEIIVISDASTDKTDEIVRSFSLRGVRLIRQEKRQGKTAALNKGVCGAQGEIIVFSDANSLYDQHALRQLMANFSDDSIGYVTGRMNYVPRNRSAVGDGCLTYIRYENILRRAETRLGSLIGVNGGIDAIRKSLYAPMRPDQQPDFVLPLKVVEQGYRVVFEENALSRENALDSTVDEYTMRVRVTLRALSAIRDMRHLLNPVRYGVVAWQLFSHKVLRYGAFIPLTILIAVSSVLLTEGLIYQLAVLFQAIFYCCAVVGWYLEQQGKMVGALYVPFYFCLVNVASASAVYKLLVGQKQTMWTPRTG